MFRWADFLLLGLTHGCIAANIIYRRCAMSTNMFPTVNLKATGANIVKLRKARGLSVKDLQMYFGFEQPQAIYKWQWGESLPSVDNLYALSKILNTPIDGILIGNDQDFFVLRGNIKLLLNKYIITTK